MNLMLRGVVTHLNEKLLAFCGCQVAAAASAPETSLRPTPLASRGARKSNGNVHLGIGDSTRII